MLNKYGPLRLINTQNLLNKPDSVEQKTAQTPTLPSYTGVQDSEFASFTARHKRLAAEIRRKNKK